VADCVTRKARELALAAAEPFSAGPGLAEEVDQVDTDDSEGERQPSLLSHVQERRSRLIDVARACAAVAQAGGKFATPNWEGSGGDSIFRPWCLSDCESLPENDEGVFLPVMIGLPQQIVLRRVESGFVVSHRS